MEEPIRQPFLKYFLAIIGKAPNLIVVILNLYKFRLHEIFCQIQMNTLYTSRGKLMSISFDFN